MTDHERALCLITRLELIQTKDLPYTPEELIEKFGAETIEFFYEKICEGSNYGAI